MTKLLDLGLGRLNSIIIDMAKLAEETVIKAIDSYKTDNINTKKEIFESSVKLRFLQEEVSELTLELIARFQPVATDLRYLKSYMDVSYGFSRFGRYAYDIIDVLEIFKPLELCDKAAVVDMSGLVLEMMNTSVYALNSKDDSVISKIYEMENVIDLTYKKNMREFTKRTTLELSKYTDNRCSISSALIMKYMERISDHASYIADSINYIKTGVRSPRR